MNNEQMTFTDLKLLEKDLHRTLTDNEALLAYQRGYKALLESIGLTDELYVAYRRALELLVTYATKKEPEFQALLNSKDFSEAINLLHLVANRAVENKTQFEFDPSDEDNENESIASILENIIDQIPESEGVWIEKYSELFEEDDTLKNYISDLYYDDELHCIEETVGDVLDLIKDKVVEKLATDLKESGDEMTLPSVIIDEVCEYLFNNYDVVSIKIVNDTIKVK